MRLHMQPQYFSLLECCCAFDYIIDFEIFDYDFLQIAGEMFREHTRKLVEENISSALLILKSHTHATYACSLCDITFFSSTPSFILMKLTRKFVVSLF